MTNSNWDDASRSLMRLRKCLGVYTAALLDWQQTMDEASVEIAKLSPAQARELADEIDEVRKNRLEYLALKERVEAGWALYQELSTRFEHGNARRSSGALYPSTRMLN